MGLNKKSENEKQTPSESDVGKIFDEIIDYFTRVEKKTINLVNREIVDRKVLEQMVVDYLKKRHVPKELVSEILQMFEAYVFGYHILEPLLYDESISDIRALDYGNVRIKRYGERMDGDVSFKDANDFSRFVDYVAIKNKVNLSDISALQSFTDKTTNPKFILRFNISSEYVNSVPNSYLQIRKISKEKKGMDYLIKVKMMDEATAKYLIEKAGTARGILFTGKGASGKTTLMNELLEYVPHNRSALVIQDNEELFTKGHPEMQFQHTVENKGEGKINYTLQDLAKNGLVLDLDYFIIGEIKGGEALYFLNAAYTGHQCWASVHGISSTEAIDKLADYVKYESNYTKEDILRMLRTMEVVVFMDEFKVKEISEVIGFDEETKRLVYRRVL